MFKKSRLILRSKMFLFFWVLCISQLDAQFAKGDKFVGGSLRFSNTNVDMEPANGNQFNNEGINELTDLSFQPQISFFVTDNLALGFGLGYNRLRSKVELTTFTTVGIIETFNFINTRKVYEILPSFRYYWKLANRAGVFLAIEAGIGKGKEEFGFDGEVNFVAQEDNKVFRLGIDLAPKFYYFITKRLNIEASFGGLFYDYDRLTTGFDESKTDTTNFGVNFINQFSLSFNYFFGKSFKNK